MRNSLSVLALVVALFPTTVLDASQAASAPQAGTSVPVTVEVTTSGLERTPEPVVISLIGIDASRPVTPFDIERATKRLDLLPASLGTRMTFAPGARRSTLVAEVSERPRYPVQLPFLIGIGSRLLFSEELVADFGNRERSILLQHRQNLTINRIHENLRARFRSAVGAPEI